MIVTRFKYPLEDNLVKKIDLMIQRCNGKRGKKDNVLILEGGEGEGKTTFSIGVGFYAAGVMGREFSDKNVFFDLEKMIQFLQSTEDQIAVWDEPALQALSKDSLTRMVKNLERLLMMARKKRHFIMINLAYFNKFSEYIVWQRPLGMIHVYSKGGKYAGRYKYIRKRNLEKLWQDWRRSHQRNYHKHSSPRDMGTFPDVLNPTYKYNVLSQFDLEAYEKNKDHAIMTIGNAFQSSERDFKKELYVHMVAKCKELGVPLLGKDIAAVMKLSPTTITKYSRELPEIPNNSD